MPPDKHVIARRADWAHASVGTLPFSIPHTPWPLSGVLVKVNDAFCAFVNRCPHAGHPLDFPSGRFLSADGRYLQCRSHGALFDLHSGTCVDGPCVGERLQALSVVIDGEDIAVEGPRERSATD